MRHICLALVALSTIFGSPADAASDGDVLKQFGMLGTFAVTCAAPPSQSNPYLIYSVSPQGVVTYTLNMMNTDLDGTERIHNLRLLAPDRLQHDRVGRQYNTTITVVKIAGKIRSWRSVRADGTVLIQDGTFVNGGSPTQSFEKCAN